MNIKTLAAVVIAVAGTLGAGLAQAHSDVRWAVSIALPPLPFPVFALPAPVYVQPARVYVEPARVYVEPAGAYRRPVVVYSQPYPALRDSDGDGIPNRYDRYDNRGKHWHHGRDRGESDRRDHHANVRWDR